MFKRWEGPGAELDVQKPYPGRPMRHGKEPWLEMFIGVVALGLFYWAVIYGLEKQGAMNEAATPESPAFTHQPW